MKTSKSVLRHQPISVKELLQQESMGTIMDLIEEIEGPGKVQVILPYGDKTGQQLRRKLGRNIENHLEGE